MIARDINEELGLRKCIAAWPCKGCTIHCIVTIRTEPWAFSFTRHKADSKFVFRCRGALLMALKMTLSWLRHAYM